MQYVLMGNTGVRVSRIIMGTYPFGVAPLAKGVDAVVGSALEVGINVFDTSNSYGNQARFDREGAPPADQRASSEELLGKALKGKRNEVLVCTKVQEWMYDGPNGGGPEGGGLTRRHIMEQVEQSLRRLGTDHIDVYHMHHPEATTPLEQSLRAMDDLVRQGKVLYVALSNYPGWQTVEAVMTARQLGLNEPVLNQVNYTMVNRGIEKDLVPAALRFGLGITSYSPLAGGLLTGTESTRRPLRYMQKERGTQRSYKPEQMEVAQKMDELSDRWGHPAAHLALAWLLSRPGVTSAVVGPESAEEVIEDAAAADVQLDPEQMAELDTVGVGVAPAF